MSIVPVLGLKSRRRHCDSKLLDWAMAFSIRAWLDLMRERMEGACRARGRSGGEDGDRRLRMALRGVSVGSKFVGSET
jgi:hypothetical protein